MARARSIGCAIAIVLAAGCLAVANASAAASDACKIIVNRQNPATAVTREFVRDAFLKKALRWSHGEPVRPVDLPTSLPAHDRFARDVLRKTSASLHMYWMQRIFSGTGVPPPRADSPGAAIAYVIANPGALGYLPADVDPGDAKVIELR